MQTQTKTSPSPAAAAEPAQVASVLDICQRHANAPGALIEILHDVQSAFGGVSDSLLPAIAGALNLSRAEVYGARTFYHDFRAEPAGRHVLKLCRAEACQAMGAERLAASVAKSLGVEIGSTAANGSITLEAVYCLGNCALAPAAMLDGKLIGRCTEKSLAAVMAAASVGSR